MSRITNTKNDNASIKTSTVKNKLQQLKQSIQKKQAEASAAIKSAKDTLTKSVAIFDKKVELPLAKPFSITEHIFELTRLLQEYNGAKNRIQLADGGIKEYKANRDRDIITMESYIPQLRTKYQNYIAAVAVNKKIPKVVQEQIDNFNKLYSYDLEQLANDAEYFNLKNEKEENNTNAMHSRVSNAG